MRGFGCALFIYGGNVNGFFRKAVNMAFKNLTQQQLADALNVDRTAIAHYERGTARPHFDNIHKLCELLDLTYEDIFDE